MHVFILKKRKYTIYLNDQLIQFLMYEDCIHTSHVCIFSTFRVDHSRLHGKSRLNILR